jgi:polar amino acid transport system permease protein
MKGFSWEGFLNYLPNEYLLGGVITTVWLTVAAIAGGLVVGFLLALCRMSGRRALDGFAQFYIWIFRGTPLLIQLIIIFTGLPQLGLRLGVVESALVGLILNEGAYLSEIIRAGFLAVPKGQNEAAHSLGLSRWNTVRHVTLPQAMRLIIPPLGNSVNSLLKATSITSVISMEELLRRSQVLIQLRFEVLEIFCVAALYYLLLTTLWDAFQRRLERNFGRAYASDRPQPRDHA